MPIVPLSGGFDNRKRTLLSECGVSMRKLFGVFIAFIAVIFLGLAYTQLAHADVTPVPSPSAAPTVATEPKCGEAIAEKIAALIEKDQTSGKDILGLQLKLTTMKLAVETLKKDKTVEAYFRRQEDLIKHLDTEGVKTSLVSLYNKYGEGDDVALVTARFTETLEKIEQGSYFKPSTRFKNQDISAYTLAHIMLNKEKSPYTKADVSILWFQSELSEAAEAKSGRGSRDANLTEVSTQIARLTGVAGTKPSSVSGLESSIIETQEEISSEFDRVALQYRDELKKSCKELETCATCAADAKENALSESHKQDALVSLAKVMQQKVRENGGHEIKTQTDAVTAVLRKKGGTVEREPATDSAKKTVPKKITPVAPVTKPPVDHKLVQPTGPKDSVDRVKPPAEKPSAPEIKRNSVTKNPNPPTLTPPVANDGLEGQMGMSTLDSMTADLIPYDEKKLSPKKTVVKEPAE